MSEFYVYAHFRKSDGRVFYIGKGKDYRHSSSGGRNQYWKRIANKHGWFWEKLHEGLTEHCAFSIEKMLIAANRPLLCNVTSGGDGVTGLKHTEETKRKMSANRKPGWVPYWKGKKMPDHIRAKQSEAAKARGRSPLFAEKGLTARTGKKNSQKQIDATIAAKSRPVIASNGRMYPSVTEACRILSNETGKYISQGNISQCASGQRENAYGLTWSYDTSAAPPFKEKKLQEKQVLCVETGDVFRSVQAAKDWVASWRGDAKHQCISESARSGGRAYTYHWIYV